MKMHELITGMIELLDKMQTPEPQQVVVLATPEPEQKLSPLSLTMQNDGELNRIKQIAGLLPRDCDATYSNEPQEQYASIEAVTTHAGGGMNGPKHPHDIRVKDPSMYPNQQEV